MGMGINTGMGVGSSAAMQSTNGASAWQQQKQNLDLLSQALSSGNLNAANQAFNALSANAPKGITNDPNSAISKIGQALKTGDLQAVQFALSALQSGGHHHHHDTSATQTAALTAPSASAKLGTLINTMA
jgi:hypothetical protein